MHKNSYQRVGEINNEEKAKKESVSLSQCGKFKIEKPNIKKRQEGL